ncbi:MAG TPA: sigma 54-interacting transcriptional regulator, partial [Terriglobales bacterium]|nr:sigma 54-interacting transcriptional regulator [Terriglobales bacterium]
MSTAARIPSEISTERYEAVLRVSDALSACRAPEDLARSLAHALAKVLQFDQLFLLVMKENSKELDFAVLANGQLTLPDLPLKDLPSWQAFDRQELLYIADWSTEERFPRFREWAEKVGRKLGSTVSVPLTTPHRRLGAFGITRETVGEYSEEDIVFLRLIGRVVAFALDDGFNLRRAREAQKCLQFQNDRLQLLLNLSKRITSNLELRELLRAIAANVREAMQCDAVAVTLFDPLSGKYSLYALDFPQGKGFLKEQDVLTISGASKRVVETLQPEIIARPSRADVAPEMYEKVMAEGLKSTCLIPLANRGRVLGVLAISRVTDTAFTSDDVDFLTQAAGQITIAIENALTFKEVSELQDKLAQEKLYLEEEIRSDMGFEQIIGSSAALRHVLELVNTVAPSDSTVLLLGETGTGKELIARAIHEHSRRQSRTFVKLNCAAIPTGLLESELFGHEKGAFTGAISQKVGRLELADYGTLFLDEVGDIPTEIQPKLLRALQEREFERLGSTHTRKVNVRLIAATNRDLEKMVADREFRSDLYYRLNVFPIRIPPLRDRRDDIPVLVSYFV